MTTTPQEPVRTEPKEEEKKVSDNGGSTQHVKETDKYGRNTTG